MESIPRGEAGQQGTINIDKFLDKAGIKMAKAEEMVKNGKMKEEEYRQLCSRLMEEFRLMRGSS